MLGVEAPKLEKKILPCLTSEQVEYLVQQAENVRDKAIISLFTESGLRLSELASIRFQDIDWERRLIKVKCKGNKEALAPFGKRAEHYLKQYLTERIQPCDGRLWDLSAWGIAEMLKRLRRKTGLPCNPHTFRRTFATILAMKGIDSIHIMRLGRWESISMVERYTRAIQFEDSLKLYNAMIC
jgi:integrase/recombinase XerC